tara:strand:- start:376 stop:510 length:135 start_codon:yes stop_codon:yes gene_type:complete
MWSNKKFVLSLIELLKTNEWQLEQVLNKVEPKLKKDKDIIKLLK